MWFPLVALLLAGQCGTALDVCSVCTGCSLIAAPVADVELDEAANMMVKSKQPSIFVPFSLPEIIVNFSNHNISPECCIELFFAVPVSLISDEKTKCWLVLIFKDLKTLTTDYQSSGYNYSWFELCRNCSWTISGRHLQATVGADSWLKVLLLLVSNCAKLLPTSTGKIILSFSYWCSPWW